ncbi:MAG: GlcNAc-PI de-N-acetylase [Chloroflexi bacterium RBG_13_66_10]|nr:MAG: GlcNAc-PI de-N-acetylase [Chloroflexi bacterium RBG_13_66_10]
MLDRHRLLAVLAHPDDETFGIGGTLALYARRGVDVHLICATRGEVGAAPPELLHGFASLAELRESELRCAASLLGLASVTFLDYRDSGMPGSPDNQHPQALAAAPLEEVAARVAHWIRRLRPDVVITFDPQGGYRHPDHIAIQRATQAAFFAAGDPGSDPKGLAPHQPAKLYYHTFPRGVVRILVFFMRLMGRNPRKWGRNQDIDLVEIASVEFPVHARIDIRPVIEVRAEASACHASQGGQSGGRITRWISHLLGGRETFMRAHPPAPPGLREHDLFEGLDGVPPRG